MRFRLLTYFLLPTVLLLLLTASIDGCNGGMGETCMFWCSSGENQEATVGQEVVLACEAQMIKFCGQDDVSILQYAWYQMDGTDVEMLNADQKEASFTPQQTGKYIFGCVVTYPVTEAHPEEKTYPCGDIEVTVN